MWKCGIQPVLDAPPLVVSKVKVKWWFVVGPGAVCVLFLCCFFLIFGAGIENPVQP